MMFIYKSAGHKRITENENRNGLFVFSYIYANFKQLSMSEIYINTYTHIYLFQFIQDKTYR